MPRYFFHVHDGWSERDNVGLEVATIEELRRETVRFAGEVLSEKATDLAIGGDWDLEVVDEAGETIFCLDVTLSASVSVSRKLWTSPI